MGPLKTKRHEDFARGLASGLNQREAFERAGYSGKSAASAASHLLKRNPCILTRVDELRQICAEAERNAASLRAGKVDLTRQWVIDQLRSIVERCMQGAPATDKAGIPIGEFRFEANPANRALELLGKELGMFVDRKEIGPPGSFKTPEERRAAELRVKAKMVKLGLARVVGSGSMVGAKAGEAAIPKGVENSRQCELCTPRTEADPEPTNSTSPDPDPAPIPPGILEPHHDELDPVGIDRLKPAAEGNPS